MADTSWPCPQCGQTQKAEHAPGDIPTRLRSPLCAACEEAELKSKSTTREGKK